MLKREDWMMIQEKRTKGVYIKDIAAELGVHPKTVSRALGRGAALAGTPGLRLAPGTPHAAHPRPAQKRAHAGGESRFGQRPSRSLHRGLLRR